MKALWRVTCEVELLLGARSVTRQYEVLAASAREAERIAAAYVMEQEDFSILCPSELEPPFLQTQDDGRFVLQAFAEPTLCDVKALRAGGIPEIRPAA